MKHEYTTRVHFDRQMDNMEQKMEATCVSIKDFRSFKSKTEDVDTILMDQNQQTRNLLKNHTDHI